MKREVIGLYDSLREAEPSATAIHNLLEMPLNHLGYSIRYVDVNAGLSAMKSTENTAAVVSWFQGALADPHQYFAWADKQASSGLQFLVFGETGIRNLEDDGEVLNLFLQHLGLRFEAGFVMLTSASSDLRLDSELTAFERPLYKVLPGYSLVTRISPEGQSIASAQPPVRVATERTQLAFIGAGGAYVQPGFAIATDDVLNRQKWLIDPIGFLQRALKQERFPIPDTSTLMGRRIYFSHIDGDGWNNVSYSSKYRGQKALSGEVMLRELIEPYPDLPVTYGLVTADVDRSEGGDDRSVGLVKELFALPQVEVASHTHSHPFHWAFYQDYDRAKELALIREKNVAKEPAVEGPVSWLSKRFFGERGKASFKTYLAQNVSMPRYYMRKPFSLVGEIGGSLSQAESFAPSGKKAKLFLWSGDTRPFEEALAHTRKLGVYNMNGGDTRFDRDWPSLSYVAPLSRQVGAERQIYAVSSNENTYTNDWTGPFYGFSQLHQTVDNTESPIRLRPYNVYYHTYSAEHDASLRAVRKHLNRARDGAYLPIFASQYAAIANSFFGVKLYQTSDHSWLVLKRGRLQSFRFDDAEQWQIDLAKSKGVIGSKHHQNSLYVSLDPAVRVPEIVLKSSHSTGDEHVASITDARWQVYDWVHKPCRIGFRAFGFGAGEFQFRGLSASLHRVKVRREDELILSDDVQPLPDGSLRLDLAVSGMESLDISLTCKNWASTARMATMRRRP
ncbi:MULTISPECIES: hypothetical protein [unclassified Pseudovibrio]|uniref:polysaccharide deacetylase family protein n=1 Tax=unclassified Pseudovibrio TaxID=2627060 RepID=UPI001AD8C106|nr:MULTISPECIES: hypothetical protein [unclassified Pseudovibrio]